VVRGREASRGLGVLEAGPAAGGRRAGSEMGRHRALSYLCSQNKKLMGSGQSEKHRQKIHSSGSQFTRMTLLHQQGWHNGPNELSRGTQLREGTEKSRLLRTTIETA
jgi:hypothetical protein